MEEIFMKLLWVMTYSSVVAAEKESVETAVMQANEAVARYIDAWAVRPKEGG